MGIDETRGCSEILLGKTRPYELWGRLEKVTKELGSERSGRNREGRAVGWRWSHPRWRLCPIGGVHRWTTVNRTWQ